MLPASIMVYGIQCDNPTCDYNDPTVQYESYPEYVNKPCPKCGSVLLTEADYQSTKLLIGLAHISETVPPEQLEQAMTAAQEGDLSLVGE